MHIYLICFTQLPHEAGRIGTPILQMTNMWLGWDMLEDKTRPKGGKAKSQFYFQSPDSESSVPCCFLAPSLIYLLPK